MLRLGSVFFFLFFRLAWRSLCSIRCAQSFSWVTASSVIPSAPMEFLDSPSLLKHTPTNLSESLIQRKLNVCAWRNAVCPNYRPLPLHFYGTVFEYKFRANDVLMGSPSCGGDFAIYVFDINQPSLPTPFYSVLVSISVFMALSTVFHTINSPNDCPLSHSVLLVLLLSHWFFQLYTSL